MTNSIITIKASSFDFIQSETPYSKTSLTHQVDFEPQNVKIVLSSGRDLFIAYDDAGTRMEVFVHAAQVHQDNDFVIIEGFAEEFLCEDDGRYLPTQVMIRGL